MPVTRQRVQITPQYATGMPTARPMSGAGQVMRQTASLAGQMAAEYGRQMGAVAEDEAKALVRGAVFSTGPNGLPQMPPDPTARMGEIARRTYDAGITEAYAHRLTQALQAQLKEAEAANLYDYDAFQEDAWNRIEAMSADVPEGFGGMFQQIATGLLVDSGASIGMRQSNLQIQNERAAIPLANRMAANNIANNIQLGYEDAAQAVLNEHIDWLRSRPVHLLNPATRADLETQIYVEANFARLVKNEKLNEASPAKLKALYERLATGDITGDDELFQYMVPRVEGMDGAEMPMHADADIGAGIATKMRAFYEQAYDRWNAEKDRMEATTGINNAMQGAHNGDAKSLGYIDQGVAWQLGRDSLVWQDWLSMPDADRKRAIASIKTAGAVPPSLRNALNAISTSLDEDQLAQGYLIYKDLKEAGNTINKSINMSDEVPERLAKIYAMAEALTGTGGASQVSIMDAMEFIDVTFTNAEAWDDKEYATVLSQSGIPEFGESGGFWGEKQYRVTEDDVQSRARSYVMSELFDGVEATTAEKNRAYALFEMWTARERDAENALELTRQQMEGTWVNSKYMPGNMRSSFAPEIHYADPKASGFMELLNAGLKGTNAAARGAAEGIVSQLIWPYGDLPESLRPDFGADRAGATMFEIIADAKIREMIAAAYEKDPVLQEVLEPQRDMMMPGTGKGQYELRADTSRGFPPVYTVEMMGLNNTKIKLGTLDVRKAYNDMLREQTTYETLTKTLDAALDRVEDAEWAIGLSKEERRKKALKSDEKYAREFWDDIAKNVIEDENMFEYWRRILSAAPGKITGGK